MAIATPCPCMLGPYTNLKPQLHDKLTEALGLIVRSQTRSYSQWIRVLHRSWHMCLPPAPSQALAKERGQPDDEWKNSADDRFLQAVMRRNRTAQIVLSGQRQHCCAGRSDSARMQRSRSQLPIAFTWGNDFGCNPGHAVDA